MDDVVVDVGGDVVVVLLTGARPVDQQWSSAVDSRADLTLSPSTPPQLSRGLTLTVNTFQQRL